MEERQFGNLGTISALTLGGGGTGQVWGPTSRDEAVATVREAVDAGINFLDVAPSYGDGEAERVIGEAFDGHLPDGVRISTKYNVGNPPREQVRSLIEESLDASLARMKLDRVDLFFLHNQIVADADADRYVGTPRSLFLGSVVPAFQGLIASGKVGAWAITGIGVPTVILETLQAEPRPATVQVVTNLLDSPGAMQRYDEPPRPRAIALTAHRCGVGVMGIRAVQAGALTSALDRELPDDSPDLADFHRAESFRALAREIGESPASLAHRYALSMDGVSTVVLGIKNRVELRECIEAEAKGRLDAELMARIDLSVGRS